MGRPQIGDSAFAFIGSCGIGDNQTLPKFHLRGEHQERAVGADRYGERFFLECSMVGEFAADNHRHVY